MPAWKNLFYLISVPLYLNTALPSVALSTEPKNPKVEIYALYDTAKDGIAMLELQFTNSSQSPITVPFTATVNKEYFNKLSPLAKQEPKTSPFLCTINGKSLNDFFLGAFAEVRYDWSLNGSSCRRGVYEVTEDLMCLKSGQSQRFCIPVQLPSSDGAYTLSITFDNTSMLVPTKGAANRLLSTKYVFFKKSTRADVSIQRTNSKLNIPKGK